MLEKMKLILDYLPSSSVIWSGLGLFSLMLATRYGYVWLHDQTMSPWKRKENLKKREQLKKKLKEPSQS